MIFNLFKKMNVLIIILLGILAIGAVVGVIIYLYVSGFFGNNETANDPEDLQAQNTALQAQIEALQAQNTVLQAQIEALQGQGEE